MLPEEYGILTELLRELKQEIQDMDMRINTNLRKIREAEAYVGTLAISESEDFKVFSPRRAETLHKEELREARECRLACEGENEELAGRKEVLNKRICMLEEVLGWQKETGQSQESGDFQAKALRSLKELAEKVEESSDFIEKNPILARQNLAIIGKCLRDLAAQLEETI